MEPKPKWAMVGRNQLRTEAGTETAGGGGQDPGVLSFDAIWTKKRGRVFGDQLWNSPSAEQLNGHFLNSEESIQPAATLSSATGPDRKPTEEQVHGPGLHPLLTSPWLFCATKGHMDTLARDVLYFDCDGVTGGYKWQSLWNYVLKS